MFKVKYSLGYKLFYFFWINIFIFSSTILFIWEAFLRTDREYEIWTKVMLVFFSVFFFILGILNLKRTTKEFSKQLTVHHTGKLHYTNGRYSLDFKVNDIKSYGTEKDGTVSLMMSNNKDYKEINLDSDMENINLLKGILSEQFYDADT